MPQRRPSFHRAPTACSPPGDRQVVHSPRPRRTLTCWEEERQLHPGPSPSCHCLGWKSREIRLRLLAHQRRSLLVARDQSRSLELLRGVTWLGLKRCIHHRQSSGRGRRVQELAVGGQGARSRRHLLFSCAWTLCQTIWRFFYSGIHLEREPLRIRVPPLR